jgi:hypothetical protein
MAMLLDAALGFAQLGISVIPSDPQTKLPYWKRLPRVPDKMIKGKTKSTWKPYMRNIATDQELKRWFGDNWLNISIVCGQVSNGLVVLDFDYEAAICFPAWSTAVGSIADKLVVVKSFKGFHVYFRVKKQTIPCQKVAYNEEGKVRIEIKGEGGVIQAPPSKHPQGCLYEWIQGDSRTIPTLTTSAYNLLVEKAKGFDKRPPKETAKNIDTSNWETVKLPKGDDQLTHRLNRYTETSVANECARLARVQEGSRNHELNISAFRIGRYIGAGLLTEEQARSALLQACTENGYVRDDGINAFERTFKSGKNKGAELGEKFLGKLLNTLESP